MPKTIHHVFGYAAAIFGVALLALILVPVRGHANAATVSLCFLLVVLGMAFFFGSRPALLASVLGAMAINFFFLPPYYTLTISEPENWVSLFVFLAVAVTVGQLSATARTRAAEAERLYKQLQGAFERASEAEALRQSEKLKSALLDAVTHDLRTPLTSIKAATTMLIEENRSEEIHATLEPEGRGDLLQVINEEADRLNTFVESMVEMARLDSGNSAIRRVPVEADEILTNAVQRAALLVESHHVVINVPDGLPPLKVDPKAIAEAIYNLIDNAVKYSPKGSTITIDAFNLDGKIRFAVSDEGKGIPVSERENVFRRFYRADRTVNGFGMGLAIVRGIIDAHGGSIWVESGTVGSRFVVELPETES
jgi:Osmosensitive K+ channel histidine kinase